MLRRIIKNNEKRLRAQAIRRFRATINPGDMAVVQRSDGTRTTGMVMNIRVYAHGETEAMVQASDGTFSAWFPVTQLLPEEDA